MLPYDAVTQVAADRRRQLAEEPRGRACATDLARRARRQVRRTGRALTALSPFPTRVRAETKR